MKCRSLKTGGKQQRQSIALIDLARSTANIRINQCIEQIQRAVTNFGW